jgi:hypothetical protein
LETQLISNGFTGTADIHNNSGSGLVTCDIDYDEVTDAADNCPDVANPSQEDADSDGTGDACDDDIDGDEVLNDYDECEDTPVNEIIDPSNGCSIEQLVPCDGDWKNHGKYISTLAKTANSFVDQGLITEDEKDDLVGERASSDCGKLRSVRSDIREHLAAIEIWMEYDYASPNQPEDDDYHFGICFDADATVEKISFLTPAGNSYEFGAEIVDTSTGDGWLYSGREYDPENTFNYEWCYEREFNTTPSALDAFGDGTYTVTMYYENGSTDQTTAWFGIPGTNNPIVQPTEPPEFTNFEHGDTLVSPVTFEWDACSSPLNGTYFELEDIVEEEYPGCTVDSYGPLSLGVGSYNADLGFETWYDSVNGDGIDVGVGKGVESDYDFFVE